jgi:glycosyltransferase A (GT-A) superfamily protein (DUF2064 family)
MTGAETAVAILAKQPRVGRSKTRLCPPFTPEEAARLACAMVLDTFDAVLECQSARKVLFLEGRAGTWIPDGLEVIPQHEGDHAARIGAAFDALDQPAILIGMDTPQITASMLDEACGRLSDPGVDAILGPAADGGWWLAGLRVPRAAAFQGVPMSLRDTIEHQRQRFASLGLRWSELAELGDVDDWPSAVKVAEAAPWTRFARLFDELAPTVQRVRA